MPQMKFRPNYEMTDANAVKFGEIINRQIGWFLSPTGTSTAWNHIADGKGPPRQAAHWAAGMAIYLFTGLHKKYNRTDAEVNTLISRIKDLARNHATRQYQSTEALAGREKGGKWGWNFSSTHFAFHLAFAAYLQLEHFTDDELDVIDSALLSEVNALGDGIYTVRADSGLGDGNYTRASRVTISPPPSTPGARQATARAEGKRIEIIDKGAGYVASSPPVIELQDSAGRLLRTGHIFPSTRTGRHGLIVNTDGSVSFPPIGTASSHVRILSYAEDLGWTSWPVELSMSYLRRHANRSKWLEFIIRNRIQGMAATDDVDDTTTMVDGSSVHDWLTPTNGTRYGSYHTDHTFGNHWVYNHPAYSSGTLRALLLAPVLMMLGGNDIPQAVSYNARQAWAALSKDTTFNNLLGRDWRNRTVTVPNRIYQIINGDGEINWTARGTPSNRPTEYERSGNYWTFAGLSSLAKILLKEPNASAFEAAFLKSLESVQEKSGANAGRFNVPSYPGGSTTSATSLGLQINAIRDMSISYLLYYMHEQKSIDVLHYFTPADATAGNNAIPIAYSGGSASNPHERWMGITAETAGHSSTELPLRTPLAVSGLDITGVQLSTGSSNTRRLRVYYTNTNNASRTANLTLTSNGAINEFTQSLTLPANTDASMNPVDVTLNQNTYNQAIIVFGGASGSFDGTKRIDAVLHDITAPAYSAPAITSFSISGLDYDDGNLSGSVTLSYAVSNHANAAGNLTLSYSVNAGSSYTAITGTTITPSGSSAAVTLPSIPIADGASVQFRLSVTDTQVPAQTHHSDPFVVTRVAPVIRNGNAIGIRGGSNSSPNNRWIGHVSALGPGNNFSPSLRIGDIEIIGVRLTTRSGVDDTRRLWVYYTNTGSSAQTVRMVFSRAGTSYTHTVELGVSSSETVTPMFQVATGQDYTDIQNIFGGVQGSFSSSATVDLTVSIV